MRTDTFKDKVVIVTEGLIVRGQRYMNNQHEKWHLYLLTARVIGRSKCELSQTKEYLRHSEMK